MDHAASIFRLNYDGAACSSKKPVNFCQSTQFHIPEDNTPHTHCCADFISYMLFNLSMAMMSLTCGSLKR
jgi:hypothetical protein